MGFSMKVCLPASSDLLAERVVRRHRGGDDDRVERVVGEQRVVVVGDDGVRVQAARLGEVGLVEVAAVGELGAGQAVEVAREVGAPVAEPDHADADLVSSHGWVSRSEFPDVAGAGDAGRGVAQVDHEVGLAARSCGSRAPSAR